MRVSIAFIWYPSDIEIHAYLQRSFPNVTAKEKFVEHERKEKITALSQLLPGCITDYTFRRKIINNSLWTKMKRKIKCKYIFFIKCFLKFIFKDIYLYF